jgi:hypothetical protein
VTIDQEGALIFDENWDGGGSLVIHDHPREWRRARRVRIRRLYAEMHFDGRKNRDGAWRGQRGKTQNGVQDETVGDARGRQI